MTFRLAGERGINHRLYGLGLARSVIEYLTFHSGPLATGPFEVGAFVRTAPREPTPNLQLFMGGVTFEIPKDRNEPVSAARVEREPGISIVAALLHMESEGRIEVTSADPDAPLAIHPNWLGTEGDQRQAIDTVRYIRKFAAQAPLARCIAGELKPGTELQTDEEILAALRRAATCGTHAVRTCRMGRDERAVVDERLRVKGVSGLRVADCSVMPAIISGNTNAPAMATGWRAADLILEDARC
jgi:choline dehydrogenase-like flavoprotein